MRYTDLSPGRSSRFPRDVTRTAPVGRSRSSASTEAGTGQSGLAP